jgi:hypothetical protein
MALQMTIVDVLFHTCKIRCPFPILIIIDLRLPRAQDKTMQGIGHDINKVCKMSKVIVQGNLMGFAPKPKPIFPVLGPSTDNTLNLKPKPTPFMAFLKFHIGDAIAHKNKEP